MTALLTRPVPAPVLTPVAVTHAAILRALAAGAGDSLKDLAEAAGRPPKNIGRELDGAVAAGLANREPLELTEAGREVLAALDRAEQRGPGAPRDFIALRHDQLRPSPLNPRKDFSSPEALEALDALRAEIVEAGRVKQNLLVRAIAGEPDAWWIVAGERRWRAVGEAIADDDWPADRPLPCLVLEGADDLQHQMDALAENMLRRDLSPLEEARAYGALRSAGVTTAAISDRAGRSQKHVQDYLKLLTLPPALLARMELPKGDPARLSYTDARALVQEHRPAAEPEPSLFEPQPEEPAAPEEPATSSAPESQEERDQPGPAARQALGELAHKSAATASRFARVRPEAQSDPAFRWLKAHGFLLLTTGPKPDDMHLRPSRLAAEWLVRHQPRLGDVSRGYATEWLNTPEEEAPPAQPAAQPPAAPPPEQDTPVPHRVALAIIELAHKVEHEGADLPSGERGARVGAYWLDASASDAVQRRLVQFLMPSQGAGWHGALTPAGYAWLATSGHTGPVTEDTLSREQAREDMPPPVGVYATSWLNVVPPVAPAPEVEPEAEEAVALLEDVRRQALSPFPFHELRTLLERAGLNGPFGAGAGDNAGSVIGSDDAEVATVDVNRELPDALAQARAELIALALNICVSGRPE